MDEGILEKIRALLALAADGSGATEAEASLAAERAQALLLKHNLEMADIGEAVDEAMVIEDTYNSGGFKWRAHVVHRVSRTNFCKAINVDGVPHIMGRKDNVAVVKEMSSWLIGQLEVLVAADEFAREVRGLEMSGNWRQSFLYGVINRVGERLKEARTALEGGVDRNSMAVVVKLDEEVNAAYHEAYPNVTHERVPLDSNAYAAGVSAGHSVSILPGSKQIRS